MGWFYFCIDGFDEFNIYPLAKSIKAILVNLFKLDYFLVFLDNFSI
jgi:hypothetical protein